MSLSGFIPYRKPNQFGAIFMELLLQAEGSISTP
jgi:hypothetical protein